MFAKRLLGDTAVNPVGLGCMNLSHAYGTPPSAEHAATLLTKALDLGIDHFDTATLYGFGANETLVGKVLKPHRREFFLASKCGMGGVNGKRVIDGRPENLRRQIDESLQRLQTDVIDLYYLHRYDKNVPIEDSVGEMSRMVEAGKVRFLGLSEVSGDTIRRAHAVHPIAAVQNEYSLWTRNPELGSIAACQEIGAALVAFSPLARGFLGNELHDMSALPQNDIRQHMPRFTSEHFAANLRLLPPFAALAASANVSTAQLALAWVLAQADNIVAIPGTTSLQHLADNAAVAALDIAPEIVQQAGDIINRHSVSGERYPAATQAEIDTEQF